MSYGLLTHTIKDVLSKDILCQLQIFDSAFSDTLNYAYKLINKGKVNVFISAGSNAKILRKNIEFPPILSIDINGFDIMEAILNAKKYGKKVVLISYMESMSKLGRLEEILTLEIIQKDFKNLVELEILIIDLKARGYNCVIGGSLVCSIAEKNGLNYVFVYSKNSIMEVIKQAFKLEDSILNERLESNKLKTILENVYSGVIVSNDLGIIEIYNLNAEKILEYPKIKALGKNIDQLIPNIEIEKIMTSGFPEKNQIRKISDKKIILSSHIPIKSEDETIGVVTTFQDISTIQKTEEKIRRDMAKKGFVSKYTFKDILGESLVIGKAKNLARIYAKEEHNVLIIGETGTGKELFAHSIHNGSNRSDMPFVTVNCPAVPENLLESQLFGYERGSFTGAKKEGEVGLFEIAHKGTIFFDEITELPLGLQSKILRAIQEREIMRVGGSRIIPVDVRVIAATNRSLNEMVKGENFRRDLYYRLGVLYISVPPLRERVEDIHIIVEDIVKKYNPDLYYNNKDLWIRLIKLFEEYNWPGNIRELINVTNRLLVILKHRMLDSVDLGKVTFELLKSESSLLYDCDRTSLKQEKEITKQEIILTLQETKWHKGKAATRLGISRVTLWRKMREYNLIY